MLTFDPFTKYISNYEFLFHFLHTRCIQTFYRFLFVTLKEHLMIAIYTEYVRCCVLYMYASDLLMIDAYNFDISHSIYVLIFTLRGISQPRCYNYNVCWYIIQRYTFNLFKFRNTVMTSY